MPTRRLAFSLAGFLLVFALAGTVSAQPRTYLLGNDSGGQLQIGGGLPLPIQVTDANGDGSPDWTSSVFPPLLIPVAKGAQTVVATAGTSMAALQVPAGVLSKPASQTTLGVFMQNTALHAVATNYTYFWPNAAATLSANAGPRGLAGTSTTSFAAAGGLIVASPRVAGVFFGGPARFVLTPNPAGGPIYGPGVPVTIYGVVPAAKGGTQPPCTHPALTTGASPPGPFPPGTNVTPKCIGILAQAIANGPQAAGATTGVTVTTPGGTPAAVARGGPTPGIVIGKFGTNGTVTAKVPVGGTGFTNMATSFGYPLTTAMLTVSNGAALGAEIFVLTGNDTRTAGGAGTLSLVTGSLSDRTLSQANANRGWVRLELNPLPAAPSLSIAGLATLSGSLLLVAIVAMARRRGRM